MLPQKAITRTVLVLMAGAALAIGGQWVFGSVSSPLSSHGTPAHPSPQFVTVPASGKVAPVGYKLAKRSHQFGESALGRMKVGEVAYTEPWALVADKSEHLFLEPSFNAEKKAGGTAEMRVKRNLSGYEVTLSARTASRETQVTRVKPGQKLIPVASIHLS